MQLEHSFVVPVPVEQAWDVLLDVERIAPCMPGATVQSFDGETVHGQVKVKVGPIQVTYGGQMRFAEKDEAGRRIVMDAKGKESRGTGTAAATVVAVLVDDGGTSTEVTVTTDLAITGKPAQFGRGVMAEVGNKLLGRFADCLAEEIGAGEREEPAADGVGAGQAEVADASRLVPEMADAGSAGAGLAAEAAAPSVVGAGSAGAETVGSAAAGAAPPTRSSSAVGEPSASVPRPRPSSPVRPRDHEVIDLLDAAGLPVLKRIAPVLGGLLVVVLIWRLVLSRRR